MANHWFFPTGLPPFGTAQVHPPNGVWGHSHCDQICTLWGPPKNTALTNQQEPSCFLPFTPQTNDLQIVTRSATHSWYLSHAQEACTKDTCKRRQEKELFFPKKGTSFPNWFLLADDCLTVYVCQYFPVNISWCPLISVGCNLPKMLQCDGQV